MPQIEQMGPKDAYETLRSDSEAALVDVRTKAEWSFVGLPDLSETENRMALVQWQQFPDMARNDAFVDELVEQFGGRMPETVLFLCRSGARSQSAAAAVQQRMEEAGTPIRCINVAEGFEGDVDAEGHRGRLNGWKAADLPWRQT
ncbi:rhodanese-like domain-containing protein [Roseobacter sp. HKCCA0434]|uniref:rhodanese-like domain-containing protein n=1 Tax=Roseobacter sp. HKCCA0434 TaxID=3079297 RepID=UPI002905C9DA|nr:rhodanese-like domain-containing protein [Roseobacter sp. HKCCA0434]